MCILASSVHACAVKSYLCPLLYEETLRRAAGTRQKQVAVAQLAVAATASTICMPYGWAPKNDSATHLLEGIHA
jgi:hypothetical protein